MTQPVQPTSARRHSMWPIYVAVGVVAAIIITVILIMSAQPTAADQTFLRALTGGGPGSISPVMNDDALNNPGPLEDTAHEVCTFYDQGDTFDLVNQHLTATINGNEYANQLTDGDLTILQSAATEAYCPQYNSKMPGDGGTGQ